jgi:hypothetical protein
VAISVVQSVQFNNGFSGSFGAAAAVGNSIVMVATGHNGAGPAITDSSPLYNGSSVTGASKLIEIADPSGYFAYTSTWLLPNIASSGTSLSITVSNSDSAAYVGVFAYEVSGLGTSPFLDKSSSGNNSGGNTSAQSSGASGNTTVNNEFIIGSIVQDGTIGPSYPVSGYTNVGLPGNGSFNSVAGYLIQAASGSSYTYNAGAGNADWCASIVSIAAGGVSAPFMPAEQLWPVYQQRIR